MMRAMAAKRPSLRPCHPAWLVVCITKSEVDAGLDPNEPGPDHRIGAHHAGGADTLRVAAGGFQVLPSAVAHPIAVVPVGCTQYEAHIVLLHAKDQTRVVQGNSV